MQLRIEYKEDSLPKEFAYWLIKKIQTLIVANIDTKQVSKFDKYLNENSIFETTYLKEISTRNIIEQASNNMEVSESENQYTIQINQNMMVIGLDRVKLTTAFKLINYGNSDIKGYPIFTDIFNMIADNINTYVEIYFKFQTRSE